MDFLGRVEKVLGERGRPVDAPEGMAEFAHWCGLHIPDTRGEYREFKHVLISIHPSTLPQVRERLLSGGGLSLGTLLWAHWHYVSQNHDDAELLDGIWSQVFSRQSPAGHLHPLNPDVPLDSFVYAELCAIHAAYRSALRLRKPEMMERVRGMVGWHVEHTQPDFTTTEPWGMAAFAALDETGTFAEQQLLDSQVGRGEGGEMVVMALLADAVLAMREARGAGG
jgi:hypothetical protein